MLASDVCLVCVHTEQQSIEALAGEDGLLAVGAREMSDKVRCGTPAAYSVYYNNKCTGVLACTRILLPSLRLCTNVYDVFVFVFVFVSPYGAKNIFSLSIFEYDIFYRRR